MATAAKSRVVNAPLDSDQMTTAGVLFESAQGLAGLLTSGLRDAGLSEQWFGILIRLYRSPGQRLRLTDLAAQTELTASGVTRALDRLEQEGLAERVACPSDRRGTFAAITENGIATLEAYLPTHAADLATAFAVLDPTEQTQLTELLTKLRDHVRPGATAGADGSECP